MNYLKQIMWRAVYQHKPNTTSYLLEGFLPFEELGTKERKAATAQKIQDLKAQGFCFLLPVRLSFGGSELARIDFRGRGTRERFAQMKGSFTQQEESPYKRKKPFKVGTAVWTCRSSKNLFCGTLGITQREGAGPSDNGDLIYFKTADWDAVEVIIFKGLARPNEYADNAKAEAFLLGLDE